MAERVLWADSGVGGATERLLRAAGCKKFLLVCGGARERPPFREELAAIPLPSVVFGGFSPNPKYEDIRLGAALFTQAGCDAVVAVGGGSCMDTAKCIKLFCRMDAARDYLSQPFADSGVPLICVPTTAGSGSEVTRFAVLYRAGEKLSLEHDSLLPDHALLCPQALATLPLYQKKCTMMDALCQAIESWWSVCSTPESADLSRRAITLIMANWRDYILLAPSPGESTRWHAAARSVLAASCLAGQAINITRTTAPHAMGYKLTTLYGLPHGHAVSLCLPRVWAHMLGHAEGCQDGRGAAHLLGVLADIARAMGCADARAGIGAFYGMMDALGLAATCAQVAQDIDALINAVNLERLGNSPVALDAAALRTLYESIAEG